MAEWKPVHLKTCLSCNGLIPLRDGHRGCPFCLEESHIPNSCSVRLSFSAKMCKLWDAQFKLQLHLLEQSVKVSSSDKLQDPAASSSLAGNQHWRPAQRKLHWEKAWPWHHHSWHQSCFQQQKHQSWHLPFWHWSPVLIEAVLNMDAETPVGAPGQTV